MCLRSECGENARALFGAAAGRARCSSVRRARRPARAPGPARGAGPRPRPGPGWGLGAQRRQLWRRCWGLRGDRGGGAGLALAHAHERQEVLVRQLLCARLQAPFPLLCILQLLHHLLALRLDGLLLLPQGLNFGRQIRSAGRSQGNTEHHGSICGASSVSRRLRRGRTTLGARGPGSRFALGAGHAGGGAGSSAGGALAAAAEGETPTSSSDRVLVLRRGRRRFSHALSTALSASG